MPGQGSAPLKDTQFLLKVFIGLLIMYESGHWKLKISLFHPHCRTNSKLFGIIKSFIIIQQNYAFGLEGSTDKAITK